MRGYLGGAALVALGTSRSRDRAGTVLGITPDQFVGSVRGTREQQPPMRIANSPSAVVTARLVVNPNRVVHLK